MAKAEYKIQKLVKETEKAYLIETVESNHYWMPKKSSNIIRKASAPYLVCDEWSWKAKMEEEPVKQERMVTSKPIVGKFEEELFKPLKDVEVFSKEELLKFRNTLDMFISKM